MKELSPSILSADFTDLKFAFVEMNKTRLKYVHLDVMDGNYVPNITFGSKLIKNLRPHTDLIFEAHLMVQRPENYIDRLVDAGVNIISFHPDTTIHPNRVISNIKSKGVKVGIVLNTHIDENILKYMINDIDLVMIMSVVPGYGGQAFIPQIMKKIKAVRKMIDESGRDIILEVDGGVKIHNVNEIIKAGANLVVAGSAIFNDKGIVENVNEFYKALENE